MSLAEIQRSKACLVIRSCDETCAALSPKLGATDADYWHILVVLTVDWAGGEDILPPPGQRGGQL